MPVFHTKTIESILDPVAQQVSRLVILHEEAEDGNAMPDLSRPVQVVSAAVANLVKVGRETINSSDDKILKQEMPASLQRVETASQLLEEASDMLRADPYSGPARKKLIEGSRGILQGTSSLLLCFDESEVRKIVQECKRVLDYLAIAEVINTMEDLVQFLKDLSPCLSKVSREVGAREKELTHQVHSEILVRCLEQVKILAPILICSMKVYIHIVEQQGKGTEEAAENRNYLASRMSDEIQEIIRVLQLTTYDEDTSELDNLTVLKKLSNAINNKSELANDWLSNPYALKGGVGEKALRQIIDNANEISERCLPQDAYPIRRLADEIGAMTNSLCELRQDGKGTSPQAESLARAIRGKLGELQSLVRNAVVGVDKAGLQQTAHTIQGRLEQAVKWLQHPEINDGGLGERAVNLIVEEGRKVAEGCPGHQKAEIMQLCDEVERLKRQAAGNTPAAKEAAKQLTHKLHELKAAIQNALVNRIVQDFMDVSTPLKQFTEAVMLPEGTPGREQNFNQKSNNLQAFSDRASKTSRMVAAGGACGNKKIAEILLSSATQVDSMTPQLINAGRIRMNYPASKAADEHLQNLKQQYADTVLRMRTLCDQATDPSEFIKTSEEHMQMYAKLCEDAIVNKQPQKMVDNTSNIARLINRVLLVAKQEADNSEDPVFTQNLNAAANRLESSLPAMVGDAKRVATNINDPAAAHAWKSSFQRLLGDVREVRSAIAPTPPPLPTTLPPPIPELSALHISNQNAERAPPRPPLPREGLVPARPPPPETDDEDEGVFRTMPHANQPILIAARGLHQEVRQWSSKDNEIIAAAKRMAILMARLSELVLSDSRGSKRELIATAKKIAESSEDVTRLAKELARQCTDRRIRTNLLQVCERIPTIGTQLKILSTVKATMLGAQGSDEDREATEMLVGNAQNLMQSVKETVRAAEGASIKIRSDQTSNRLQWVRRQPWYQY
ncbi:vinculin [Bactrocera oleae]|uniref:vinculin n=1 Tax=Bactrocera oleae TaxID=104688 RepID=UPI0006B74D48|nr:vinculin [Bactrocera oleae]XP_014092477.1 vinculin [Bactrocera oleae]XP_014092485.1 vinculin [Bactrocera oleae]XP_014092493.1 vinculin [Bactrocera oleae]XP_036215293.1 vinculin [Bactrocera oleae]XP_036215294.1 vinculin [Bactrocera oleae]XP_036215295.1 vinculin [Bactrocera oleae]XP_036215296.1 vinculin [Bactrocera oleae]XP_036215297.1 vinculin [Bactrocera oleae]